MEIIRKHFKSLDSTHKWAKKNVYHFLKDKITLVSSEEQTAGRGRLNRHWVSPPGQNAYLTYVFFLDINYSETGHIPQILALSTIKILEKQGLQPRLKWPNDILIQNKKVGGILTETTNVDDKLCILVSIGININMPLEWLETIDRPATSLLIEGGKHYDVENFIGLLTHQFVKDLDIFFRKGYSYFLQEYKDKIALVKGEKVRFHNNLEQLEGEFESINDDGSLCLKMHDGRLKTFVAGELI